jgi:hypothetical protein
MHLLFISQERGNIPKLTDFTPAWSTWLLQCIAELEESNLSYWSASRAVPKQFHFGTWRRRRSRHESMVSVVLFYEHFDEIRRTYLQVQVVLTFVME